MYVIWILAIVFAFFCGIFFGSRLYYQMRVKKDVQHRITQLTVQLSEVKWNLTNSKLGTPENRDLMAKYHSKKAQLDELKWVLSFIECPEDVLQKSVN